MNSLKDIITAAQINYSLDFTSFIDEVNESASCFEDQIINEDYPTEDTEALLNDVLNAQTKAGAEEALLQLDAVIDLTADLLRENIAKLEKHIETLEEEAETLGEVYDLISQANDILGSSKVSSNFSLGRIESTLSDVLGDLESEKSDLENQCSDSLSDAESRLDDFIAPIDSLIALLKKEIAQMPEDEVSISNEDEVSSLTPEELRISWEGANAQDIANLVNKILTNKESATHLALEAIKAERFVSTPDYNSCPNGPFSK